MRVNGRYLLLAAIVVGSLAPIVLDAQERKWEGSFGAGPTLPVGRLSDEAVTGYHVMGSVGYNTQLLPFGVRANFFYQNFNAVDREPSIYSVLGGEWYRQLGGSLSAKYVIGQGVVQPYALAGGGWNYNWHSDRTYWPEKQQTVDFTAGFGIDLALMGADAFLEVRHLNLFGGEALPTRPPTIHREVPFRSIPLTLGVRF